MPLIILPNFLDYRNGLEHFPGSLGPCIEKLDCLIAESEKSARRYLVRFLDHEKANALPVYLLNEHSPKDQLDKLLKLLKEGRNVGLISDAGLPVLADPGSELVLKARRNNVAVRAVLGPSAIVYALLTSGLPAQSFSFEGYLPREEMKLKNRLKTLEKISCQNQKTIFFIEAPYRNNRLLKMTLETLHDNTLLAVAAEVMTEKEEVSVKPVKAWKKQTADFHKRPAVFLLYAARI